MRQLDKSHVRFTNRTRSQKDLKALVGGAGFGLDDDVVSVIRSCCVSW